MSNPGPASTATTAVGFGLGAPVRLGNAATDTIGFYGAAGVAQASAIPSVTTDAPTSTTNAYGYSTSAQAAAIVTAVNSLITALKNLGATA